MKYSSKVKWSVLIFALALISAFVVVRTAISDQDNPKSSRSEKGHDRESIKSKARIESRDGKTYVVLGSDAMRLNGIETVTLTGSSHRAATTAYGTVIMPQVFADDAAGYSSALASYRAAISKKGASQKEYERLKTLFAANNVSDKVVQAARAQYEADDAAAQSAAQTLQASKTRIIQKWGEVISGWMFNSTDKSLVTGKDLMIQAALPAGETVSNINEGIVNLPDGTNVTARFVSTSPTSDPLLQGTAYFFLLPAGALLPGTNVTVHIESGKEMSGVVIPSTAVVWAQGVPWVYLESGPGEFTRQLVSTDEPTAGGFFITGVLKPGDKIVTKSAQVLLSIEFSSQIQTGDEG